jgi:hypothetical protein
MENLDILGHDANFGFLDFEIETSNLKMILLEKPLDSWFSDENPNFFILASNTHPLNEDQGSIFKVRQCAQST